MHSRVRNRLRCPAWSVLTPVVQNGVSLRALSVSDSAEMVDVLSGSSLYEFTGGEPPSEVELQRRYAVQTRGGPADGSESWLNFVVVLGRPGHLIGFVQATVPNDEGPTEIAWVIGERWQSRGYGRAAAELLVEHLRPLGAVRVMAHIHPDHLASQRIAAHLGMSPTTVVSDGEVRWAN